MNWRKPLIDFFLILSGNPIPKILKEIRRIEFLSEEELNKCRDVKLKELLRHSFLNVSYYTDILKKSEIVDSNLNVNLDNFKKIPFLTKDIIRKEKSNLYSKDICKRKYYRNTSGGSTGEPVEFIQDKKYYDWNVIANKIYFNSIHGKSVGDKEINLWGSERDILRNSLSIKEKIINFLYNRTFLNSFKVDQERLNSFVNTINKVKPKSMWVYVESIDILAKFIKDNKLKIHSPDFIITTAGTLYPEIRKITEEVFNCPVYNQYGSREVGPVAIECENKNGLHYFPWSHYIEIIDNKIYVTVLTNYSMPLIRYDIGDTGCIMESNNCQCGRKTLFFKEITGRTISHFKTKNGGIVHGQFLIHMFYFRKGVKKFQIVQNKINEIDCNIVGTLGQEDKIDITEKVKKIMEKDCIVNFNFVDEIIPSKSGKFLYTECNI